MCENSFFFWYKGNIKKKIKKKETCPFPALLWLPSFHFWACPFYYGAVRQAKPKIGNFFAGCEADSSPSKQIPKLLGPTAPAVCTQASAPCTRTPLMSLNHPRTGIKAGLEFLLEPISTGFQMLDNLANQRWKRVVPTTTTTQTPKLRANITLRITMFFWQCWKYNESTQC